MSGEWLCRPVQKRCPAGRHLKRSAGSKPSTTTTQAVCARARKIELKRLTECREIAARTLMQRTLDDKHATRRLRGRHTLLQVRARRICEALGDKVRENPVPESLQGLLD